MSVQGPPPELLYRFLPLYQDAFWRFATLHRMFPARVSSMYRDEAHNRRVGGAPRSQHLLGLAVDWVVPAEYRDQFIQVARFLGLVALDQGHYIHVQRYAAGTLPAHLFPDE